MKDNKEVLTDDDAELEELLKEYDDATCKTNTKQSSTDHQDMGKDKHMEYAETPMDEVLFGGKTRFLNNLAKSAHQSDESKNTDLNKQNTKKRKPAWIDEDDDDIKFDQKIRKAKSKEMCIKTSYKKHLATQFTRIRHQPKWAKTTEDKIANPNDDDDDDELLRTVGFLSKSNDNRILAPKYLDIKLLKDLNRATYAEGKINCIEFHPTSTAAIVAGEKGIATIYAVDGVSNSKLHNIHIPKFPIKCAKILPCGTKVIFGSTKRFGYVYDLLAARETRYQTGKAFGDLSKFILSPCGQYLITAGFYGEIHIYDSKSFEIIHSFKQNAPIGGMCFSTDSNRLICNSSSMDVCIYSMRQQKMEHRFIDDGCIKGNAIALAPNQRLLATGSMEGVVNVYDYNQVMTSSTPIPEKRFLNLRTAISQVQFNHTSELLAFASTDVPNAVKIAHFPSATVYANYPYNTDNFEIVRTIAFSPHSAYFALGSIKRAHLIRVKHFDNY